MVATLPTGELLTVQQCKELISDKVALTLACIHKTDKYFNSDVNNNK